MKKRRKKETFNSPIVILVVSFCFMLRQVHQATLIVTLPSPERHIFTYSLLKTHRLPTGFKLLFLTNSPNRQLFPKHLTVRFTFQPFFTFYNCSMSESNKSRLSTVIEYSPNHNLVEADDPRFYKPQSELAPGLNKKMIEKRIFFISPPSRPFLFSQFLILSSSPIFYLLSVHLNAFRL